MILLAESGSTKTDWRVIGHPGYRFETIGLNPYFVDSDLISAELIGKVNFSEKISKVFFYGTGITDTKKGEVIQNGIYKALGYPTEVITYSDIVAAARSAFGKETGMVGILGTGSNSCYWINDSIGFQIPPLGFWLGDEGSGGHIGKMLILSYLHNEMPGDLRSLFEDEYGLLSRTDILTQVYQKPRPNKYFAEFTLFVNKNKSHPYINQLIHDSFDQYFKKYLLKYPMLRDNQLAFVGSIAHYFQNELKNICQGYGLVFNSIISKPIEYLERYHLKNG